MKKEKRREKEIRRGWSRPDGRNEEKGNSKKAKAKR